MKTASLTYQFLPKLSFQDKQFSLAKTNQYHLAIALDKHNLRICGIEILSHQCLFVEAYNLHAHDIVQCVQLIRAIWKNHRFLNDPSWNQVTLAIANQQYTLIPQALFQPNATAIYLNLATDTNISYHKALHYTHSNLGLVVAFAVAPQLLTWFQETYQESQRLILHQANTLIAGNSIYYHTKRLKQDLQVFLHIETHQIHITVLRANQLYYYNRFFCQDSEAMLRYLLLVMHTLQQDPNKQEVLVSGNMVKSSLAYSQFKSYIRQVTLINPCQPYKLSWRLGQATCRHHFDLLHIYSCRILNAS